MSTASWSDSGRYRFIDALRGVAVLLVLIIHISEIYVQISSNGRHSGRWIADISHEFDFGRMGVTIFFLISGFVIPSSFVGDRLNGTLKFLISRFFRLFVSGQPTTSCLKFQGMSASVSGQAATSGLKFHGIRASIS
ncbi:MAG: acyltransferase family protein [Agrobacterium sp.]|nr:acyltransferase family protein [Agrobacterium sp.]